MGERRNRMEDGQREEILFGLIIQYEERSCKVRMLQGEETISPKFGKNENPGTPIEAKEKASVVRIWREAYGERYEKRSGNKQAPAMQCLTGYGREYGMTASETEIQ